MYMIYRRHDHHHIHVFSHKIDIAAYSQHENMTICVNCITQFTRSGRVVTLTLTQKIKDYDNIVKRPKRQHIFISRKLALDHTYHSYNL